MGGGEFGTPQSERHQPQQTNNMSNGKLVNAGIDLAKIPASAIREDDKGRKWLNVDVWINDTPDKYDNDASISIQQTKEQRDAKEPKVYLGNGKKKFGWDDDAPTQTSAPASEKADLPF